MPESAHRFAWRRLQCSSADMLPGAGQDEFESPFPQLIDHARQGFKHYIRSCRQMVVQQDDVSARYLAQDALGQDRGIRRECITRPNTPRNILKARVPEIGPQKGMAQANRRAERAWLESTATTNTLGAALDLGAQTPGREKTTQRGVRPGVVCHQMTFGPSAAHDFRILVRALSHHKERRLHTFLPEQVQ